MTPDSNASGEESDPDSDAWNYEADLDQLKLKLQNADTSERVSVRDPLAVLISSIPNVEFEDSSSNGRTLIEKTSNNTQAATHVEVVNRINPLDIELILETILSFLSVKMLLVCRFVNESWNRKAVFWIRQYHDWIQIETADFPWFCIDFRRCKVFPFAKLKFAIDDRINFEQKRGGKFFTQHGSKIDFLFILESRLRITDYNEAVAIKVLEKAQYILRHVPNLKGLWLSLDYIPRLLSNKFIFDSNELLNVKLHQLHELVIRTSAVMSQEYLDRLFAMAPNVEVLHFARVSILQTEGEGDALVEAMRRVKFRHVGGFLGEVRANTEIWRAVASTQKLRVIELYVDSDPSVETQRLVQAQHDVLKSQSKYLEYIILWNGICYEIGDEKGPKLRLPLLEKLTGAEFNFQSKYLMEDHLMLCIYPVQPEQVPNLKTLRIYPKYIEMGVLADSAFTMMHKLILDNYTQEYFAILPKIATRFPNLKILHNLRVQLGTAEMNMIVSSFPNMEYMDLIILRNSEQADFNKVISGVPSDIEALEDRIGLGSILPFIDPPESSLCDLQHLKRLELIFDSQVGNPSVNIDEIGVYLTFLRLSPKLTLYLRGDFKIRDDLAVMLTAYYQNIYIVPSQSI